MYALILFVLSLAGAVGGLFLGALEGMANESYPRVAAASQWAVGIGICGVLVSLVWGVVLVVRAL